MGYLFSLLMVTLFCNCEIPYFFSIRFRNWLYILYLKWNTLFV